MSSSQRVTPGQPWKPRASDHNAFHETAQYCQHLQRSGGIGVGRGIGGTGQILVRNDSGEDRYAFDVLGLGGPVFEPDTNLLAFQTRICLKGVEPTNFHRSRFAILQQPIKAGDTGRAIIFGPTIARLDFSRGWSTHADINLDSPETLEAIDSGSARILWPTGEEYGYGYEWKYDWGFLYDYSYGYDYRPEYEYRAWEWGIVTIGAPGGWVAVQAASAHLGYGTELNVYLGWWDRLSASFVYDTSRMFKAIDWRYGVPTPGVGATGRATWKPDDVYGSMLHIDDWDCEIPS